MSFIFVAVLSGSIAAALLLAGMAVKAHRRRRNALLLWRFSQAGSQHGLRFSSQELLGDTVIGLDGISGKLLVVRQEGNAFHDQVLDLRQVTACSLEQEGGGRHPPGNAIPRRVLLRITRTEAPPLEVTLFSQRTHRPRELKVLERKGRSWEAILNKLMQRGGRSRDAFR